MAARVRQARWGDAQPNLRELTIEFQEVEKICFRISPEKRPCSNLGPTPRIVANAEVITDGQNRRPQFGDSTADSIKTPGWDIGSTQDQPGEAQENMPPPVRH
jgi:hypothetical protein